MLTGNIFSLKEYYLYLPALTSGRIKIRSKKLSFPSPAPAPTCSVGVPGPLGFSPVQGSPQRVAHTRCTPCSGLPFDLCPRSFPLQPTAVRPAVLKVQHARLPAIQGALLRVLSVDVFLEGVRPMRPSWEQDARQRGAAPARLSRLLLHSNTLL